MKKASIITTTEQALETISLSSWERQRSMSELLDFLDRREAATVEAEL
jgi:hypothetical protein